MTTIACNREEVAADSQETWGFSHVSACVKVQEIETGRWKGCIIAMAGASHLGQVVIDHITNQRRHRHPTNVDTEAEGGAEGVILCPNGDIYTVNESCRPKLEIRDYAVAGCGADGAGALIAAAGFTPTEAVKAMCKLDAFTREPVVTFTIKKNPKWKLKGHPNGCTPACF